MSVPLHFRRYAESVDRRLKNLNLIVEIVVITEDRSVTQMVEDASRKNVLFALVCNSQNEVHQSVTLNILHGTAQGKSSTVMCFF